MNEEELKIFAERVKNYRASKLLSQEAFALECGITQQTVCHIEKCKYVPTLLTVRKILNVIEKDRY